MDKCRPPFLDPQEDGDDSQGNQHPYSWNKELYARLTELGKLTTHYCRDALREEAVRADLLRRGIVDEFPVSFMESNARAKQCVQLLLSQWTEFYVQHMEAMREIHTLKLGEGRPPYAVTMGANVFYEISRLHWLRDRPRAALEWENTQLIEPEDLVPHSYDVLFTLEHTKSDAWITIANSLREHQSPPTDEAEHAVAARELQARTTAMWKKPIACYTCSETRVLAMFLTQYLNDVPSDTAERLSEFGRVFRILWLRCTDLSVCEYDRSEWPVTLDEEEFRAVNPQGRGVANRRYAVFCSFYLGEVMRRFFHHEELSPNRFQAARVELPDPELLKRMRARMLNWVHHVVQSFAEEAFEEMYMTIVTGDGYAYPGDAGWFRYAYPQRMASRGAIVTALRPHMYRRFFSEVQVDRRLVVNASDRSHLARLFVLRAVDEHIKITHPRVEWINGVVIDNDGIEMSTYALKGDLSPLLVQAFSAYWVYHKGHVYPTDDLFVSLALWWWFLREHHNSRLYNVDLSAFMAEALEPRPGNVSEVEATMARFEL